MSQSLMVNFNKYFAPAIIETLSQKIALFNAASGGMFALNTAGFDGDFLQESFWKGIHSAQRRVDRYKTNDAVAATELQQGKRSTVKVAGGFGPVVFEPSQMTWFQKPTAEGIEIISRNMAEALLSDQLNTLISALVAAISNQAAATYDASALTTPEGVSQANLNNAHAKFGDASANLIGQVMTGATFHKLIGQNIANANGLFNAGNVRVVDILGRVSVITDAPSLVASSKERILSLSSGAGTVTDAGDIITNIETSNGKERIETTFQSDYTFALGLNGYSWDEANGGKSPTNAELATGSNWDLVANSIKKSAGVILIGDPTK